MKYITLTLLAALLVGCSGETPKEPRLKPEMLVTATGEAAAACMTKEDLAVLVTHVVKGESTKAMSLFTNLHCFALPKSETYKILSIDGGAVEITHINSGMSAGLWAVEESFQEVKK